MVSHTNTGEWQSFEVRMRHRRAERLALRAEIAAEAGCVDDARECVAEARSLVPALPALEAAEAAISQAEERLAAGETSPADAPVPVSSPYKRWIPYTVVATVAMAVLAGWGWTSPATDPSPQLGVALSLPKAGASGPAPAATPLSEPVAVAESERVGPPPATAEPRERAAAVKSEPVDARRPLKVEPLKAELPRSSSPAVLPTVGTIPPPTPRPTPPSVTETPLSSAISAPGAPVAASIAMPPPPAPAAAPTAPEPPQDSGVRNVLGRYAAAYNALDVNAATRVWPGVNRGALARAFDSLASQQVSLGDCSVDVSGAKAQARCAGRATWTPKIGSGTRTESRSWTFELARAGNDWQIVSARVQNR